MTTRPAILHEHAAGLTGNPRNHEPSCEHGLRRRLAQRAVNVSRLLDWLATQVILFRAGNLVFVTFGLFAALGALATLIGSGVILIGQGLAPTRFLLLGLLGCVGVVLGSWLVAQLFDYRLWLENPREALRRPAFVSWGGILSLPVVFLAFAKATDTNALLLMDAVARASLLGHALGRLGCLSYGCCFGHPTRGRLAVTYHNPAAKAVRVAKLRGVPLHPTALYEAVMDIAIFVVVNTAALVGAPLGVPAALSLLLYGLGRFAIEFLKDNHGRIVVGTIAINHIVCLALVAIGAAMLRGIIESPEIAPEIAWWLGLGTVRDLLPAFVPTAGVVFVGFSLHRHRVGSW